MVSETREIICLTLVSRPGVPSLPRKYLLTTTFVAICDQNVGISQSFCSKTFSPFSLPITAVRVSQVTSSKGCTPSVVKRRSTWIPPPSTSTFALTRVCTDPFRRPERRPVGGSMEMSCESSGMGLEADRSTVFPLLADGRFIVRRRVLGRRPYGLQSQSPRY